MCAITAFALISINAFVAEGYYSFLQETNARDMLEECSCLFNSPACARFCDGLSVRRVDKTVGDHATHNHSYRLKRLAAMVLRSCPLQLNHSTDGQLCSKRPRVEARLHIGCKLMPTCMPNIMLPQAK